jgi:hypothetical protein
MGGKAPAVASTARATHHDLVRIRTSWDEHSTGAYVCTWVSS